MTAYPFLFDCAASGFAPNSFHRRDRHATFSALEDDPSESQPISAAGVCKSLTNVITLWSAFVAAQLTKRFLEKIQ
jgi:hypothetical protein